MHCKAVIDCSGPGMGERHAGLLGATSLIGEYLIKRLVQNGWHVTAFSRRPVDSDQPNVNWQQLVPDNPTVIGTAEKIPVWFCVAPIWILPDYFSYLSTHTPRRIIVISSTSRFTKDTSSDPGERDIARRLVRGEEVVQAWAAAYGVECVILRPTLIYGYGRDKNIAEIARFVRRFGFFPLLGRAEGLRQPVHVEDIVSACYAAGSTLNLKNHTYTLTGGETLTYREMVYRVFVALNHPARMPAIPHWIFRSAAQGLGWLPRYRHWTPAMAERMNQDLVFDCTDATRELDFFPRPFNLSAEDLPGRI